MKMQGSFLVSATAATGVRYRRLPLTPEEVLRGMLTKGLA
jgi:hypothetical protein